MTDDMLLVFGGLCLMLVCPVLVYSLARYGFAGLFYGMTWTNFGPRTGFIARLYGIWYVVLLFLYGLGIVYLVQRFFRLGLEALIRILSLPVRMGPEASILFIVLGPVLAAVGNLTFHLTLRRNPHLVVVPARKRAIQAYSLTTGAAVLAIGIFSLAGFPLWTYILVVVGLSYLHITLHLDNEAVP
jgi:hypothetical protein